MPFARLESPPRAATVAGLVNHQPCDAPCPAGDRAATDVVVATAAGAAGGVIIPTANKSDVCNSDMSVSEMNVETNDDDDDDVGSDDVPGKRPNVATTVDVAFVARIVKLVAEREGERALSRVCKSKNTSSPVNESRAAQPVNTTRGTKAR